jgi:hypothetical protein
VSFFEPLDPKIRCETIEAFIKKLSELESVIIGLPGFRFWSGSLLVIYDPSNDLNDVLKSVTVKMIDFANYTIIETSNDYDKEYLFGIETLLRFLKSIQKGDIHPSFIDTPPDVAVQDRELAEAAKKSCASPESLRQG